MKMKKFLALVLALAMLLTLAACGRKDGDKEKPGEGTQEEVPAVAWADFSEDATTEKTVLNAENGSVITVQPVEYLEGFVEIKVAYRNNTENVNYLKVTGFAVNDVMIDTYMNIYAEAGATVFDMVDVSQQELRMKGVFEIAVVDLLFVITDEDGNTEEAVSCRINSSAAEGYAADPDAYVRAITSQEAQEELGYAVADSDETREELGLDVYMESKVYAEIGDSGFLLLEVVNESEEMRFARIYTDYVNGMACDVVGESYVVFPGAKAIITIDTDWALPPAMREAFSMSSVAQIDLLTEVYACLEDGDQDWDVDGEYQFFTYTVADRKATPDMTGEVVYEEGGLKIMRKNPITETMVNDDTTVTYVYFVVENTGDTDFYVTQDNQKDIDMDGECGYFYFQEPYYVGAGGQVICCLTMENMEGSRVTLPLLIENGEDDTDVRTVEINIAF